jgi:putative component of membrane protein insertase Oxa1/YidC/SpoIIIJ protein YidD
MSPRSVVNRLLIALLYGGRFLLGPAARCRYLVTCTEFAAFQLKEQPLPKALWAILIRLLRCW